MTKRDLLADALAMAVKKNFADVTTLLQWAHGASDPDEKLKHVEQAIALLQDVAMQIRDMSDRPVVF